MRSIWKGHIRFLLVAIPIRVYNAIEASERVQFNQLHREDFGPVGYDKRCKKCGQIVSNDEITKGYQYEPDRYAIVEPDEIAKIKIKTKELQLATSLVEQMVTSFSDVDTVDHYHEALRQLIDSKIKGKKVTEFEKEEEIPRLDIMTALKKSLQASSRKPMVKAAVPAAKKKAALTLVKATLA